MTTKDSGSVSAAWPMIRRACTISSEDTQKYVEAYTKALESALKEGNGNAIVVATNELIAYDAAQKAIDCIEPLVGPGVPKLGQGPMLEALEQALRAAGFGNRADETHAELERRSKMALDMPATAFDAELEGMLGGCLTIGDLAPLTDHQVAQIADSGADRVDALLERIDGLLVSLGLPERWEHIERQRDAYILDIGGEEGLDPRIGRAAHCAFRANDASPAAIADMLEIDMARAAHISSQLRELRISDGDGKIIVSRGELDRVVAIDQPLSLDEPPSFRRIPSVGDRIELGRYPQDASGQERPIGWRVLAVHGNRAYLVTESVLMSSPFNADPVAGNNFATSDLKALVNGEFAVCAFTDPERTMIAGFLTVPSVADMALYFVDASDRLCMPTAWTLGIAPEDGPCSYWLRTPGKTGDMACCVLPSGCYTLCGVGVDIELGVRVAAWVDFNVKAGENDV